MAISQGKSTRSPSGARNVANRGKRKSELGRDPAETRLDAKKLRKTTKNLSNFCEKASPANSNIQKINAVTYIAANTSKTTATLRRAVVCLGFILCMRIILHSRISRV